MIPACKYYGKCGGCQLQHLGPQEYRAHKGAALSAIPYDGAIDWVWTGPATRRRAEFKVDKDGRMGFYAAGSHDVVAVDSCPALVPKLEALIPQLAAFCSKHPGIEKIFLTAADSGIDINLTGKAPAKAAESLTGARITLNGELVLQHTPIRMDFSGHWVDLAPGGFLQPTRQGQAAITETIRKYIPKAKRIAEFFCGSGSYSFMLSEIAPVIGFEASEVAVAALNKAAGASPIRAHVRDLEKFPVQKQEIEGVDVAVLNPPRNGAAPQCKALARSDVRRIVIVSCHPHTLARDMDILTKAGFKAKALTAIDQFHWTQHLEAVVLLERPKVK